MSLRTAGLHPWGVVAAGLEFSSRACKTNPIVASSNCPCHKLAVEGCCNTGMLLTVVAATVEVNT